MGDIQYIGFDNYSRRYCYRVYFSNQLTKVKFLSTFNMNFGTPQLQAELDKFVSTAIKVTFVNEADVNTIKALIERVLS
jgi:hypothetical protein